MSSSLTRSYESPESSDSEDDKYASPSPLEYEVPGDLSDSPPELPERDPIHPSTHPDESTTDRDMPSDLYTTLTHKHMPSVYSIPCHSTEFRANTAVTDSTFDITHLQSTTTINEDIDAPLKFHSRVKMMILLFLLLAIMIGMVSLVVSMVAVFVTRGAEGINDSCVTMEDMAALQQEVLELQTTIAMMMNQTSDGSVSLNLTSYYDSCMQDMRIRRCDTEQGYNVEFSCITPSLPLEKVGYVALDQSCFVIGEPSNPVSTTIISNRSSVRCNCHFQQGIGLDNGRMYSTVPMCVMNLFHCPLEWNVTIDSA